MDISERIGDHNLDNLPNKTQATGFVTLTNKLANNDWRSEVNIPLLYNTEAIERKVELGDYLVGWQRKSFQTQLGHHAIAADNLIMSGFQRRGLSASYALPGNNTLLTGFAMRGSQVSGFERGLGLGDSTDRIQGGMVTTYPVQTEGKTENEDTHHSNHE
ncbi:hypothetical protein MNBD_GAMMA26-2559 [hydrothermal vent metagenome]|uniref:Uncharacterized protein n=1 Tax=hydrothermal vent metagenome TaxID=652676 RepID=A0A3B1BFX3_9ZZZZ